MNRRRLHRLKPRITQIILVVMGCLLVVSLVGCEAFRRKFVRKPQAKASEESFYAPKTYPKRPGAIGDEYSEYYAFWKRSQEELIGCLNGYYKKQIASSKRTIDNLTSMRDMLKQEKAGQLTEYIKELNLIQKEIKESHGFFTPGKVTKLSIKLTNIYNDVRKNYSYNKVKDFVKDNE